MKVKIAQSCLILCYTMDCSPPDFSVHEILQAKTLSTLRTMGCHSVLQGIFSTPGSNLGILHCRQIFYHLSHQESLSVIACDEINLPCVVSSPTLDFPQKQGGTGSPSCESREGASGGSGVWGALPSLHPAHISRGTGGWKQLLLHLPKTVSPPVSP